MLCKKAAFSRYYCRKPFHLWCFLDSLLNRVGRVVTWVTWVAWVKFLRGSLFLRGLCGSKCFTWVKIFCLSRFFCGGLNFCVGHFFGEDGSQKILIGSLLLVLREFWRQYFAYFFSSTLCLRRIATSKSKLK